MNVFAEVVLIVYLPAALALYLVFPPRRATLIVLIGGWLFLPVTGIEFQGIPNYTKMSAIAMAVVLGTVGTEPKRLLNFRPRWFDVPMAIWCFVPFVTSMSNDLGVYDGLSAMLTQTLMWGVPWLMGRVWFSDAEGMRELAMGVMIGGMIYVPLCLYEVRMSPQLHNTFYGAPPSSFIHVGRFGGFRPVVFMRSGLEVGLWMTAGTLAAFWLWTSGTVRQVFGLPLGPLVGGLAITAVLCKSLGALLLLIAGLGILYTARWTRLAIPALMLAAIIPTYMYVRTTGTWMGENVVNVAASISEARAQSLGFRFDNEEILIERAIERPVFGWGGWGRSRVTDEDTGTDVSTTDGMWIIAMGQYGIVGLTALTTAMLLPIVLLWRRCPTRYWRGPPAVLAVIVLLFMADNLLNAMPNPVYMMAAGAVCGMPAFLMRAVGAGQLNQRGQVPLPSQTRTVQPSRSRTLARAPRQRPVIARQSTRPPDPWTPRPRRM
ncbi:MAG: hypothetical protein WD294_13340 [Phycisphaeraceae bacterium]